MQGEIMVVAGEASGDHHGAAVVAALARARPSLRFFGMAGPLLEAQGVEALYRAREISVMGLTEVLPRLPRILAVLEGLAAAARERRPAAAVLIDVPDFNMPLARRLKRLGIPVVWYVAPMAWAWRPRRAEALARVVDRLLCILPFEERFFRERGVRADFVGSPVLEHLPPVRPPGEVRVELGLEPHRPTLALAPGSRRSELVRLVPALVDTASRLAGSIPHLQLVLPLAPGIDEALVREPFRAAGLAPVYVAGRLPEVVNAADVAVVASGTATLEAGLMGTPLVAVYRLSAVTFAVARRMVTLPAFSLVNLLLEERVIPELVQGEVRGEAIVEALGPLWAGPARERCVAQLGRLRGILGGPGASRRAADAVLELVDGAHGAPRPVDPH